MKLAQIILVVVCTVAMSVLLALHFSMHPSSSTGAPWSSLRKSGGPGEVDVPRLISVLQAQNETITSLVRLLEMHKKPGEQDFVEIIRKKDQDIQALQAAAALANSKASHEPAIDVMPAPPCSSNAFNSSSLSSSITSTSRFANSVAPSSAEADCETRYGLNLIHNWKNNKQSWCDMNGVEADVGPDAKPTIPSQLDCYPMHQHHKKLDGRGPDLFCTATNFIIDFSKV